MASKESQRKWHTRTGYFPIRSDVIAELEKEGFYAKFPAAKTAIVVRCVRGIDARGLHKTNLAALRSALRCVAPPGSICLVDGFRVPEFGSEQQAVIDGDEKSAAIASASILAKVTRDRYMRRAAELHPGWDFHTNVGYSTPEHRAAIAANGVSPLHRRSFDSIAYQQLALGG